MLYSGNINFKDAANQPSDNLYSTDILEDIDRVSNFDHAAKILQRLGAQESETCLQNILADECDDSDKPLAIGSMKNLLRFFYQVWEQTLMGHSWLNGKMTLQN